MGLDDHSKVLPVFFVTIRHRAHRNWKVVLVLLATLLFWCRVMAGLPEAPMKRQHVDPHLLSEFYQKVKVTIVVTDIGLGGMSVLSEIEQRLQQNPVFHNATLLYFNAAVKSGYTKLPIPDQISMFESALGSISLHRPDAILIACNTLSVLYPETSYAKSPTIPVFNIVEFGADLLAAKLLSDPGSAAIIFGTSTTVNVGAHTSALIARGVGPERIASQACPSLATTIQTKGASSSLTKSLISSIVHRGIESLKDQWSSADATTPSSIIAGLCCTHYAYSLPLWSKRMEVEAAAIRGTRFPPGITVINPNTALASYIFEAAPPPKTLRTGTGPASIFIRVVSMVSIDEEVHNIAPLLSAAAAAGLLAYELQPDHFGKGGITNKKEPIGSRL